MNQLQLVTTTAAERSQWLAEIAQAVDEAQRLTKRLGESAADSAAAKEIYDSLEAIRIEVDSLRRGGWVIRRGDIDPNRTHLFPWNRRQTMLGPKK